MRVRRMYSSAGWFGVSCCPNDLRFLRQVAEGGDDASYECPDTPDDTDESEACAAHDHHPGSQL